MNTHAIRLQRLREGLSKKKFDAFILLNIEDSDRSNLYYMTGFSGSFGVLIITQDHQFLLTDSRYIVRAQTEVSEYDVIELKGGMGKVTDHLNKMKLKHVLVNAPTTTVSLFHQLRDKLKKTKLVTATGIVENLRTVKDTTEVTSIERAIRLTDRAFEFILDKIKPGVMERELAWEIEVYMRRHGAEGLAFPTNVSFGPATALPHYEPGDVKAKSGDFVLFDMGAKVDHYCADLTRTVVLGRAKAEQKKIYNIVLEAQKRVIDKLCAGLTSKQADAAARETIKKAGYSKNFGHGTGHGIGIDIHEDPRLSPLGKDRLRTGNFVTVEPGIYIVGWGGVRIEDVAVVEEKGYRVLTKASKQRLIEI